MPFYKKDNFKVFIGGCLLGIIFFLLIYGFGPLVFTNDSYIINGYIEKDISQHYSGWMLYRNSPWQFPLGVGQNIEYPYGNAVTFTDSIPLFAIFFKFFRSILPATFQYFGLFTLICYMLQGGFGALIGSLFNKNYAVNMFAAMTFILTPVMIERAFRHVAFSAHFLILAALYYYFRNKNIDGFTAYLPFIIINTVGIAIHPYFMPFTFGIMFAFCVEKFFISKQYKESCLYLAISLAVTAAAGYIIGLFTIGGGAASQGYGIFNMNLNALYNPVSKGFENWSAILAQKPHVTPYQIEGFNYLGLGIIVFIPVCVAISITAEKKNSLNSLLCFIKNYFGIIFSTTALFVFAIGNVVSFGGLQLFRLPFPDFLVRGLFGIFRANGRFTNLLVYMIIIFIVYTLSKIKKSQLSCIMFAALLAIQAFDISPVLISKYNYFHENEGDLQAQQRPQVLYNSFWDDAAERYEHLYMISDCVPNANFEITSKFAKANKTVNSRFTAKINEERFQLLESAVIAQLADGTLNEDTLVLLNFVPDRIKDRMSETDLNVYLIEGIVAITNIDYPEDKLDEFTSQGNFEEITYPYIVQAEIDFKAEYGYEPFIPTK